eukprot:1158514-Pelagomonas_calceolata.AAC.15
MIAWADLPDRRPAALSSMDSSPSGCDPCSPAARCCASACHSIASARKHAGTSQHACQGT